MEEKNQNQEQGLTTEEVKAQIAEVIAEKEVQEKPKAKRTRKKKSEKSDSEK